MSGPGSELPEVPKIEVAELLQRADAGEKLFLLDVRNDDEFERWKVEAKSPIETLHEPYFDFIEDEDAAMAKVPKDREVVVLCAQGDSSEMIAEMLNEQGYRAKNVAGGMVSYGQYLQPVAVPLRPDEQGRFEIWQLNRRGKGCLTYVVRAQDEAIVVDPSRDIAQIEAFLDKLGVKLVHVLDTHVHADHVSGGPELAEKHGVPYFVAAGGDFELNKQVTELEDGEEIELGGEEGIRVEVQAVATPGHTPGSTSYRIAQRYLLSGDTIFVASVGRPDLGGQVVEWGKSLFHTLKERIASLPDDTVVLPAHYADVSEIGKDGVVSGRLGDLRRTVPELQIDTEEEFVAAMRAAVTTPPSSYADIIKVNLGVLTVGPDKLTEWELGKNQCAAKAARGAGGT
jgi:glyoxylase-like metal-dependent hydrolase (beta-lactamase superfamily II)/rhodanese-related sulfurtransferase